MSLSAVFTASNMEPASHTGIYWGCSISPHSSHCLPHTADLSLITQICCQMRCELCEYWQVWFQFSAFGEICVVKQHQIKTRHRAVLCPTSSKSIPCFFPVACFMSFAFSTYGSFVWAARFWLQVWLNYSPLL